MVRPFKVLVVSILAVTPAAHAEDLFDPNAPCADELKKSHEDFLLVRTGWAMGYLAATSGNVSGFGEEPFEELIEKIEAACAAAPDTSYVDIVKSMK